MGPIGRKRWAIPEGHVRRWSSRPELAMAGHEVTCIPNATDWMTDAQISVFFTEPDPAGPYHVTVPARRTSYLRCNELREPEPIPTGTSYASVIGLDVPVVVQHTRLGSRQAENALVASITFPAES